MFEDQSEIVERAKAGLTKREALLKGELQAEGVRKLLGLAPQEEYPRFDVLPERFFLPAEIIPRVASMTRQLLEKGKEKECFIGFRNGKYWLGEVHHGDEEAVRDEHRNYFPKRGPDYLVMEMHTHKVLMERYLPLPSSIDVASFLIGFPQLPTLLVNSDSGAWVLVKSKKSFEMPILKSGKERIKVHEEVHSFMEKSQANFISSGAVRLSAAWESLLAAILERYGVVLYSSNPRYLAAGQADSNPILDPKQKVEMVRISGETHKKFLAE